LQHPDCSNFQRQVFKAPDSDEENGDAAALGADDAGVDDDRPVENSRTSGRSKAKSKKKLANGAPGYNLF
jgi:hypothetical protein